MPVSKPLPAIFVPTFEVTVNHVPLPPPLAKIILEVSVTEHLNPPNQFSFRLHDPKLTLINAQAGVLTEGSRVELKLGYVNNTKRMITGEISALTADFPNSGPATLTVDGFDLLHRLTRGTFYRRFQGPLPHSGPPDSEIVKQIAAEMGLTPSTDPTPARTEPRVQDHITNLAFVEELARANGYFPWVDGDTLYFKHQRPTPNRLSLEWGKTLNSFSPRLSTAGQVNTVEVRGWDPIQKQSFSVRVKRSSAATSDLAPTGLRQIAQGSGGRSELVIQDTSAASAKEAQAIAEAILSEQQRSVITGSGTSIGQPEMRVGTELELSGLGRFNGVYTVEQVTHTVGDSGYHTSFQVRR